MSTAVVAYISDKSEDYKKHLAVYEACKYADIARLPTETAIYFNCRTPTNACWDEVNPKSVLKRNVHVHTTQEDSMTESFEVYVDQIPKDVEKIVFTISY